MSELSTPVADTRCGPVRGRGTLVDDRAVRVWRGIPFAAPPVGSRRFRPPEPAEPWLGQLDATEFGPAAPQTIDRSSPQLVPGMLPDRADEDCLTLNVWEPVDGDGPKPVLVWFHGGSFLLGSSSLPTYDAGRLAADGDVVVVSANYRVGALGFLWLDQANCGLLDQIAALEWVRDNIAGFGGDPTRVTIFGESAGGGSVLHLLASPRSEGLAHRAIALSGATTLTPGTALARELAAGFLDLIGVGGVAELRDRPVEEIVGVQNRFLARLAASVGAMPFHPVVDGDVLPAAPLDAFRAGRSADVELVLGTTADEMRLYLDPRAEELTEDRAVKWVTKYLAWRAPAAGIDPAALLATYRAARPSATLADCFTAIQTDGDMRVPALRIAEARTAHPDARTWLYRFDWPAAARAGSLGAHHAVDLPFLFATFDAEGWAEWVGAVAPDDRAAADALSAAYRRAWCSFARTGDPGWPAYDLERRPTMLFGRARTVVDDPAGAERHAWDAVDAAPPG